MASRTKKARPAKKGRAVQAPTRQQPRSSRPWLSALAGAGAFAVVALIVGVAVTRSNGGSGTPTAPRVAPGLPDTPDYHSLVVSPTNAKALLLGTHYGLYRSTDGGNSFSVVSTDVGPAVMALVVMRDGRILAGDMQQGLMISRDGGRTWARNLRAQLMGLALNPTDPKRILASGPGVSLSTNGGGNWKRVLDIPDGGGPVAWSQSNPKIAYVVGFDRTLYRSIDSGQTWSAVG